MKLETYGNSKTRGILSLISGTIRGRKGYILYGFHIMNSLKPKYSKNMR